MDSLRSFVLCAQSEAHLLVRRVLFGLFSPVIHGQNDFAERFPSLGGSVLDMERVARKDFPQPYGLAWIRQQRPWMPSNSGTTW
jgi:hypothetical protein